MLRSDLALQNFKTLAHIVVRVAVVLLLLSLLYSFGSLLLNPVPTLKKGLTKSRLAINHTKSCPSLQISADDGGQLGNQINSYAQLLAVSAELTNYSPFLREVTHSELIQLFPGISIGPASPGCQPKGAFTMADFRGPPDLYPKFLEAQRTLGESEVPTHLILGEFPFNPDIFHHYRERIRKEFRFKDGLRKEVDEYMSWLRTQPHVSSQSQLVSIHVRRGDYQTFIRRLVGTDYFRRAIDALRESLGKSSIDTEKLVFVVTSNDPKWCKENMKVLKEVILFTNDYHMQIRNFTNERNVELAIAASCDHAVFDYGTYGFWGAYLQNNPIGSHVIAGDMTNVKSHWDILSMKAAAIPNWSFVKLFPEDDNLIDGDDCFLRYRLMEHCLCELGKHRQLTSCLPRHRLIGLCFEREGSLTACDQEHRSLGNCLQNNLSVEDCIEMYRTLAHCLADRNGNQTTDSLDLHKKLLLKSLEKKIKCQNSLKRVQMRLKTPTTYL